MNKTKQGLEKSMNAAPLLVAYIFAYVKRLPSKAEIKENAAVGRQIAVQSQFCNQSGARLLTTIVDCSTYRGAMFASRDEFRRAAHIAREAGAGLLLADIRELMVRTRRNQLVKCVDILDALDIEIWDAYSRRTWRSLKADERNSLIIGAAHTGKSLSGAVKIGIQLSRTGGVAPDGNYKRGNRANRLYADQRARRHRELILNEMAKLQPGEKLSPSALAAMLNAAGIPSARGGRWSHKTAKDLIARISKMAVN
jgi:hypothetical protein